MPVLQCKNERAINVRPIHLLLTKRVTCDLFKVSNHTICTEPKADILLLMDASSSISPANWGKLKRFAADLVGSWKIGSNNVRVGAYRIATYPRFVFTFGRHRDVAALQRALLDLDQLQGLTATGHTLNVIAKQFYRRRRRHPPVPCLVIVITDGNSNDFLVPHLQHFKSIQEAAKLQNDNITIITVGVGKFNK